MTTATIRKQTWEGYLGERTGTYEYRTRRYSAVADELEKLGLTDMDMVTDIGAGWTEFDRYLRCSRNFGGRYLPVDGCLDGTDLEEWTPNTTSEFFVAIEVIEHLNNANRLMENMLENCIKGVVITTPNPATVDVLAIDRTHVTSFSEAELTVAYGMEVKVGSFFGTPDDTLIGIYKG